MYYLKKSIKHLIKSVIGLRPYPKRYDQIFEEIDKLHPQTICEIGTNDGINAVRMCQRAFKYSNTVEYFGFDLFESIDKATFLQEFAIAVPSLKSVEQFLGRKGVKNRKLFFGNTIESLPNNKVSLPKMDLVFIDGGHSEETVSSDWNNVIDLLHPKSVVFFDDYPNWGVGPVVDSIDRNQWDVQIMPIEDVFAINENFSSNVSNKSLSFKIVRVQSSKSGSS